MRKVYRPRYGGGNGLLLRRVLEVGDLVSHRGFGLGLCFGEHDRRRCSVDVPSPRISSPNEAFAFKVERLCGRVLVSCGYVRLHLGLTLTVSSPRSSPLQCSMEPWCHSMVRCQWSTCAWMLRTMDMVGCFRMVVVRLKCGLLSGPGRLYCGDSPDVTCGLLRRRRPGPELARSGSKYN